MLSTADSRTVQSVFANKAPGAVLGATDQILCPSVLHLSVACLGGLNTSLWLTQLGWLAHSANRVTTAVMLFTGCS